MSLPRSSKNYRTSIGDISLSDWVVDPRGSMYCQDRDVVREKAEDGWKCPYCGKKFKYTAGGELFTLDSHLAMSPECIKELRRGFKDDIRRK